MQSAFEWDPFKAEANEGKHGVSFVEAASALLGLTLTRLSSNGGENRFASIGITEQRLIVIIWTPRLGTVRIISARRARLNERETYRQAIGRSARIAAAD
jgi:uncharacterized DUF497 family protein